MASHAPNAFAFWLTEKLPIAIRLRVITINNNLPFVTVEVDNLRRVRQNRLFCLYWAVGIHWNSLSLAQIDVNTLKCPHQAFLIRYVVVNIANIASVVSFAGMCGVLAKW